MEDLLQAVKSGKSLDPTTQLEQDFEEKPNRFSDRFNDEW